MRLRLMLALVAGASIVACAQPAPHAPKWTMVAHVNVGQTPGP